MCYKVFPCVTRSCYVCVSVWICAYVCGCVRFLCECMDVCLVDMFIGCSLLLKWF